MLFLLSALGRCLLARANSGFSNSYTEIESVNLFELCSSDYDDFCIYTSHCRDHRPYQSLAQANRSDSFEK